MKMSCIATPILPPGQTMVFERDMNELTRDELLDEARIGGTALAAETPVP